MATLATQVRDSARARRAPRARGEAARFGRDAGVAVAALALFAAPLPYLVRFDQSHALTATLLSLLLCGLTLYSRRSGIVATTVFLAFLGDYRRYAGLFE